jgi:sugar phosphate isomerase/epimerase
MQRLFQVGLNPYGLPCSVGLIGRGTRRGAPKPLGLNGFVEFGEAIGARCLEFDHRLLATASAQEQHNLGSRLRDRGVRALISSVSPSHEFDETIKIAGRIGARVIRIAMTTVLCGDRSAAPDWREKVRKSREELNAWAPRAAREGIDLAIENHQDLGSEELLSFAEEAGENVGICFDTGNPLAVGEDILSFALRVSPRVRHVHLKDYRAQFTDEGYRLVRCPIGDGCVPFVEIEETLNCDHECLSASLELGALESRHIRLFTPIWWKEYPRRTAVELGQALGTARSNRLPDHDDWRTPWELDCSGEEIARYEMEEVQKSVANMRTLGWL